MKTNNGLVVAKKSQLAKLADLHRLSAKAGRDAQKLHSLLSELGVDGRNQQDMVEQLACKRLDDIVTSISTIDDDFIGGLPMPAPSILDCGFVAMPNGRLIPQD